MNEVPEKSSPRWGPTTKLVVALTLAALIVGLVIQFRGFIAPLLMALVLAYLLNPIAGFLQRTLRFSWPVSVTLIYLVLFLIVIGVLTLGGLGLVQQIESLVSIIQTSLTSLPDLIHDLSGRSLQIGSFAIDFSRIDTTALRNQIMGIVQPLLGSTGTLLGSVATGAAQFLGWALFVLLISYFVLTESGDVRGALVPVNIPGYADDIRRLGAELSGIWNAFLRGQIIVFLLATLTYLLVLTVLGVRYSLGIAFLAGIARFIPYVGNFVSWTTLALVAYFQGASWLGLNSLTYAIVCVVSAILIDQTFDNFVTPRIISQALRVHPAAVLIAALVLANLLGLLGVVVAAPILATLALFWRYLMRKMLDLEPWPDGEFTPRPRRALHLLARIRSVFKPSRKRAN